jgi:hypothetical protein
MQAIGDEIGGAVALYRWVHDREHLLVLVSAELARMITTGGRPTERDWRQWLIDYVYRLLAGPHRHTRPTDVEDAVVAAFRFGGARAC